MREAVGTRHVVRGGWLARALAGVIPLALAGCTAPERVERVVLVSIDTLRADRVGCYGAPAAETRTLDGLAERGVRFETAVAPTPITLPSHATLLTGLDPLRHGARHNGYFRLGDAVPTLAEAMHANGFATAAFVSAFVLDARFGLARGFDVYDDRLGLQGSPLLVVGVQERPARASVDAALAWLEDAPERFFLWLHLYDPHANHEPPPEFAARFPGRLYEAEIAYADAEVGRLLAAIEARFGARGTLVVATSDHGESLGEHGENTHSLTLYDATQRVPLVLAGPGVPHGRVVTSPLARLADVAPTVLALSGLPALASADGESLVPTFGTEPAPAAGAARAPARSAWLETLAPQLDFGWSPLLGIRTATHKYIRAPRPELYDLAADPGELVNRAAEEPALVAELDALVSARVAVGTAAAPRSVSEEERARLEALGYVASGAEQETPLGVVGGRDPKDELPRLAKLFDAMGFLAHGHPREALGILAGYGPLGFDLELLRAEAALGAGELALARSSAERALTLSSRAPALVLLGRIAEAEGAPARADADYRRALALDAEHAPAHVGLGRVAEAGGRRDDARRAYESARGLPLPDAEAYWRLAALDLEQDRADTAQALLAQLPQAEVRKPEVALRLARAELAAGRLDLARTRLEGALRAYPHDPALQQLARELEAGTRP